MAKYFFVFVMTGVLYPLTWYFMGPPGAFAVLYSDLTLASAATGGVALSAVLSLALVRVVSVHMRIVLQGFYIILIGSLATGFCSVVTIYGWYIWDTKSGMQFNSSLVYMMFVPAVVSTYLSYWLADLFVWPITPHQKIGRTQK